MTDFKIDPQEIYVWLAYENGWSRAAGFRVKVNGIEFSAVLSPTQPITLIFSEWKSGARITSVPIPLLEVIMSDTKEKTLILIEENSRYLSKIIEENGVNVIKDRSEQMKIDFESKFGPMPEVEILEGV